MTATMDAPTKSAEAATILKRCVCLVLSCGYLGNSRKVDLAQMTLAAKAADGTAEQELTDREKKQVRASKQLVDSKELNATRRAVNMAKDYLHSIGVQGHRVFGPGTYLVPIALVTDAEAQLTLLACGVRAAASALADRWAAIVAERRQDLGPLFNEKEYATAGDVREAFEIDWTYVSFAAPDQLADVDRAVFEATVAKHEKRMGEAYDEYVLQLRAAALKIMRELAERLKPGADGKPKALRGTALRDLQDFAALLPQRNVAGDDPLAAAVQRVTAYAEGLSVETLKDAPAVRAQLAALAEAASGTLEGLVEKASRRAISFGAVA